MSKRSRKHRWDKDANKRPALAEHSEAKHRILSEYIQKYLAIVCQSRKIQQYNLTLVDGFAGGGTYQEDKKGSPLVMMDAVAKATIDINQDRLRPVKINPNYFFVEKDDKNYKSLEDTIEKINPNDNNIILKNGDFNKYTIDIISHIKKRNPKGGGGAIFFLDQDGYAAVSIESLNNIRKELPKAEIIININISWLIDFIDDSSRFKHTISRMGLEQFVNFQEISTLKEDIKENRFIIESRLSTALQKATNFNYFRPFFIEPHRNHRGYWLLHLSPHYRAHNGMSEIIWQQGNYMRHYGGVGTKIMEISYKGGLKGELLDIYGKTFNENVKEQHLEGLVRDLPEIIWNFEALKVNHLIESTCNNTAASQGMYEESLLRAKSQGDIMILGKLGGKKRSNIIRPSDIIIPNKQMYLFT